MDSLFYYKLNQFPDELRSKRGMDTFIDFHLIFNLHKNLIDRLGLINPPIRLKLFDQCKLPDPDPFFNLSFEDCCDLHTQTIWAEHKKTNRKIYVLMSGGVDSTAVLVSFLKNYPYKDLQDVLKIVTGLDIFQENPNFTRNHLLGKFEFISAYDLNLFARDKIIVTGKFCDNLFGFRFAKPQEANGWFSQPCTIDKVQAYLSQRGMHDKSVAILSELLWDNLKYAPIDIEMNADFLWWLSFNFVWQQSIFRFSALATLQESAELNQDYYRENIFHFFGTHEFQRWAMKNKNRNYIGDYKKDAKELIFKYDKDEDYFLNKSKRQSISSIVIGRTDAVAIDHNFKHMYSAESINQFYQGSNVF